LLDGWDRNEAGLGCFFLRHGFSRANRVSEAEGAGAFMPLKPEALNGTGFSRGAFVDPAGALERRPQSMLLLHSITHLAIGLIKKRLSDAFGPEIKSTCEVIGEPTDFAGAAALAAEDKYQFQWWALGLVGARPADQKKGADYGIDGRLYFHDDDSGQSKQIIFSVKAGGVSVPQVRDLVGVLAREKADLCVFLTFDEPTKPMLREAAEAGFYRSSDGTLYPRLQILTIQQILDGRQPEYPIHRRDATFKKAPKSRPAAAQNLALPLLPPE